MFGGKETSALLRILRNLWFNYKLYARRPYLIGLSVGASRIVLLSWNLFLLLVVTLSFFLLFDAVCLFVAFPCVHHHEHLVFAFVSGKVCLIIKKEEVRHQMSTKVQKWIAFHIPIWFQTFIQEFFYILCSVF